VTLRATLDTSVLMEYWKQQKKADVVRKLLERAQAGRLDLVISARILEDVPRPPLADRINELPVLSVQATGAVTRLDYWVLGRDLLGSEAFAAVEKNPPRPASGKGTEGGGRQPDWRDWDHLHVHYLSGRDVFLTFDTGMLKIADELRARLGVTVLSPEQFLSDPRYAE
jgi:hypothetical protein